MASHRKCLHELDIMVRPEYLTTFRNIEYGLRDGTIGEIDLTGIKKYTMDFFEVKSHYSDHSMVKAICQLQRAREYWRVNGNSYIFTPETGIITLEDMLEDLDYLVGDKRGRC